MGKIMNTCFLFLSIFEVFFMPFLNLNSMSETTGGHTISFVNAHKFGCVGKALPGLETKLVDIDNSTGEGEIHYNFD